MIIAEIVQCIYSYRLPRASSSKSKHIFSHSVNVKQRPLTLLLTYLLT